jgi:hypothetical protein
MTPAIFLDRDGTIIVERDYLSDPAGAELEVNAATGLRRMALLGWPLVVITNQSGVGPRLFHPRGCRRGQRPRRRAAGGGRDHDRRLVHLPRTPPTSPCDCRKPAPRHGAGGGARSRPGWRALVRGRRQARRPRGGPRDRRDRDPGPDRPRRDRGSQAPDAIVCEDLLAAALEIERRVTPDA